MVPLTSLQVFGFRFLAPCKQGLPIQRLLPQANPFSKSAPSHEPPRAMELLLLFALPLASGLNIEAGFVCTCRAQQTLTEDWHSVSNAVHQNWGLCWHCVTVHGLRT